jgi:hypothetical protein
LARSISDLIIKEEDSQPREHRFEDYFSYPAQLDLNTKQKIYVKPEPTARIFLRMVDV